MIPEIEDYIYTRLQADTTLTAIVGTRTTNIYGSRATLTFPYVVFQVTEDQEFDTMRGDGLRLRIEFHVYDVAEGNTNNNCRNIIERIRGDAATQTNKQPTFGFHRLIPTDIVSNWSVSQFMRTGGSTAHERDVLHYIETYEVTGSIGT